MEMLMHRLSLSPVIERQLALGGACSHITAPAQPCSLGATSLSSPDTRLQSGRTTRAPTSVASRRAFNWAIDYTLWHTADHTRCCEDDRQVQSRRLGHSL